MGVGGFGGKRKLPNSFTASAALSSGQQQEGDRKYSVPTVQRHLPLKLCKGRVMYLFSPAQVDALCGEMLAAKVPAVGFDMEWRVQFLTGQTPCKTALIQLAFVRQCLDAGSAAQSRDGGYHCALLHVAHSGMVPNLKALLASQDLIKAGVGISGDAQKLMRDFALGCNGLWDLSDEANLRLTLPCIPRKWGLADLTAAVLFRSLAKDPQLRLSNWERLPLSEAQMEYAAMDAIASLRLYESLQAMPLVRAVDALPENETAPQSSPMDISTDFVQALNGAGRLQPAKLAVLDLHCQGASLADAAAQRRIKLDTAESYVAEAIHLGHAYCWQRLGIKDAWLAPVARALYEMSFTASEPAAEPHSCNACKGPEHSSSEALQPCPCSICISAPSPSCRPQSAGQPGSPAGKQLLLGSGIGKESSGQSAKPCIGLSKGSPLANVAASTTAELQRHAATACVSCPSAASRAENKAGTNAGGEADHACNAARVAECDLKKLGEARCETSPTTNTALMASQALLHQLCLGNASLKPLLACLPFEARWGQLRILLAHLERLHLLPKFLQAG